MQLRTEGFFFPHPFRLLPLCFFPSAFSCEGCRPPVQGDVFLTSEVCRHIRLFKSSVVSAVFFFLAGLLSLSLNGVLLDKSSFFGAVDAADPEFNRGSRQLGGLLKSLLAFPSFPGPPSF